MKNSMLQKLLQVDNNPNLTDEEKYIKKLIILYGLDYVKGLVDIVPMVFEDTCKSNVKRKRKKEQVEVIFNQSDYDMGDLIQINLHEHDYAKKIEKQLLTVYSSRLPKQEIIDLARAYVMVAKEREASIHK